MLFSKAIRTATRLQLSPLMPVAICLCAFVCAPVTQSSVLPWLESAETEVPLGEDQQVSEEELLARPRAGRSSVERRHSNLSHSPTTSGRQRGVACQAGHCQAIVGHQLANGLRAPLVI